GAPWDGQRGGIVAFFVSGTFDLSNGAVSADGLGFRGGAVSPTTTGNSGCTQLDYTNSDGAPKGEGIATTANNGRGAVSNRAGASATASDGLGGGGAGGSIYIRVVGNAAICGGGTVFAEGGDGGSTTATGVGPGGGGAGGRLFIQSSNSCSITAANYGGGANG